MFERQLAAQQEESNKKLTALQTENEQNIAVQAQEHQRQLAAQELELRGRALVGVDRVGRERLAAGRAGVGRVAAQRGALEQAEREHPPALAAALSSSVMSSGPWHLQACGWAPRIRRGRGASARRSHVAST